MKQNSEGIKEMIHNYKYMNKVVCMARYINKIKKKHCNINDIQEF